MLRSYFVSGLAIGLAAGLAIGCGDPPADSRPAPDANPGVGFGAPGGIPSTAAPGAAASAQRSTDPRLLLFDLQTALEAAHAAAGSYPTTDAFQLEPAWQLQR
ncbi:MAG: hypothetical protein ABR559_00805, partial [Gemmatimonadota bacterium]